MALDVRDAKEKVSVCLVDYNPLAASVLRRTLERDRSIRILPYEHLALKRMSESPASVFVLDKGALPAPLINFLRSLRFRFPEARTIILDDQRSCEELIGLLRLGVHGFVLYNDVERCLRCAIHAVSQGHYWIAQEVLEGYITHSRQGYRLKSKDGRLLTRREKEIIEFLRRRYSNKQISSHLSISASTVKFHLSNIFTKFGVHDRRSATEVLGSHLVGLTGIIENERSLTKKPVE